MSKIYFTRHPPVYTVQGLCRAIPACVLAHITHSGRWHLLPFYLYPKVLFFLFSFIRVIFLHSIFFHLFYFIFLFFCFYPTEGLGRLEFGRVWQDVTPLAGGNCFLDHNRLSYNSSRRVATLEDVTRYFANEKKIVSKYRKRIKLQGLRPCSLYSAKIIQAFTFVSRCIIHTFFFKVSRENSKLIKLVSRHGRVAKSFHTWLQGRIFVQTLLFFAVSIFGRD